MACFLLRLRIAASILRFLSSEGFSKNSLRLISDWMPAFTHSLLKRFSADSMDSPSFSTTPIILLLHHSYTNLGMPRKAWLKVHNKTDPPETLSRPLRSTKIPVLCPYLIESRAMNDSCRHGQSAVRFQRAGPLPGQILNSGQLQFRPGSDCDRKRRCLAYLRRRSFACAAAADGEIRIHSTIWLSRSEK